jgi:hypothetical protein
MSITSTCIQILDQLATLVKQIEEKDFYKPSGALSGSTVGQHLRHTLEFFCCLEQGFDNGTVNYDKRSHDKLIETDKFLAIASIEKIISFVSEFDATKSLTLEVGYDLKTETFLAIQTNALRELVYNIEHAVHHMAIMKIGIREVAPYIVLPSDFGVAASTVRHKERTSEKTTHH